jgi:predicted amidohydrolase
MEMKLKIALAQLELEPGKPETNLAAARDAVIQAAQEDSDLLLLPELWASGYDLENAQRYASSLTDGWFLVMREMALEHGIALGGSMIEQEGEDLFNTFLLVDHRGEQLGTYRKAHLFDLIEEKTYFSPGKQLSLIQAPWGILGLALCYDLRFPELFRAYALKGAEIILLVAEWPRKRIAHWDTLLLARAIENQCFIAAVNKVGLSKGEQMGGNSVVINPMGEILVKGDSAPAVLLAEIEAEETAKVRDWMPVLTDRNPAVYD